MSAPHCDVEGELGIETPHGPIRCIGTGAAFEITFLNVRQLVRVGSSFRSGTIGALSNWLVSAAQRKRISVKLRIGKRIVGDVRPKNGKDRPRVKLRFLSLAAAVVGGNSVQN